MLARALALFLILPAFVSAGIFPQGGPVKMLQDAVFRKTLKPEVRPLVRCLLVDSDFRLSTRGPQ